jgi:hypothetical protein
MKIRVNEIPVGSCFVGKNGQVKKKVSDDRCAVVGMNGRVSTRKMKGDPEVEPTGCPLKYLAVGLRRHPDAVVEIGDGNLIKNKGRK